MTLEWCTPLPEKFAVRLVGCAFGPNIGREFVMHVGDNRRRFILGASAEERVLEFSNPRRASLSENRYSVSRLAEGVGAEL